MTSKFAVFCPIKDEKNISPIWVKYYSKFLPKTDLYFLDFNSENMDYLGCRVIKTNKNILCAQDVFKEIKKTHTELLKNYEYVLPTDVDELIYHPSGLDVYIKNLTKNCVRAKGYDILHLPDKEPDYDLTKKIFAQRNYWTRQPFFDKVHITNKTLDWWIGLHNTNTPVEYGEDLLLLHLHRFDYKICINRHLEYANKQWSNDTIKNNYNFHYREKNLEKIVKDYYWTAGGSMDEIVNIPEDLKSKIDI